MKAFELIASRENWTQGHNARDEDNEPVSSDSPRAVSFCLLGALGRTYSRNEEYAEAKRKVLDAAGLFATGDAIRDTFTLIDFNDLGTHQKVVEALRKADV
jgi:hypothetical protein